MNRYSLYLFSIVWKMLPFRYLKQFIFSLYLSLVRGKKTTKSINGIVYDLDLSEMIDVCIYLSRFEKDVSDFISRECKPGFYVIDVGANVGAHCLSFASLVGESGKVFAFEPTTFAFKKLTKNISLNNFNNINAYQIALSNLNSKSQLIQYRSSWKTNGQNIPMSNFVDFVKLDDWADEFNLSNLDLLKIDVDGNEFSVLAGAVLTLTKYKPVIIAEVGAWHFIEGENPWSLLESIGYSFWNLTTNYEYSDLSEIRGLLPTSDPDMSFSINILAKCT